MNKLLIFIPVLIIVFFGLCLGAYFLLSSIKNDSQEILNLKEELASLAGQTETFGQLQSKYSNLKNNLAQVDDLLINSEAPIDFIEFLENTALSADISADISAANLSSGNPFRTMDFQINFIGAFPDCLRFIEKMENAPYLIEVQSVNATKLSQESAKRQKIELFSSGDVSGNLSMRVFAK